MTIKRMDHVSVVVDDLPAAIAFFTTLGMALEGEMPVEGPWVDRLCGLEGVQVDITMMRTPDGHGRVELTKFRNPELVRASDCPAEHAGPPADHVRGRRHRRHRGPPARPRRRTRRRGGPGRGQVQALLHARPCGHHRRAGRGTLLTRSPLSGTPVAPRRSF